MPDNHVRSQIRTRLRIFFPIGVLLGVVGVSLWLLFYLGAGIPYPNVAHARLMIEGFMASFIFGFLGTAGPRITSAPHFSLFEVATIFTLDLLAAGAHAGEAVSGTRGFATAKFCASRAGNRLWNCWRNIA